MWGDINASSFGVTNRQDLNNDGLNYVAYIFAHDDARFGTNDDESIIKCGSWTASGGAATVDLGFEPQLVLMKMPLMLDINLMFDSMRGMTVGGNDAYIAPNANHTEDSGSNFIDPTPTGFKISNMGSTQTFVYMAIRRPHKPATVVSDIFDIVTAGGAGNSPPQFTTDFPVDLVLRKGMNDAGSPMFASRLQGTGTMSTAATGTEGNASALRWDYQNGWSSVNETDPNLLCIYV